MLRPSIWKLSAGLCRSCTFSVATTSDHVQLFLNSNGFRLVPISERAWNQKARTFVRFDKGRHPGALNMGDCFACTKTNQVRLPQKGDNFTRTDLG